jgi:sugar phosphate isomerase/epimerase
MTAPEPITDLSRLCVHTITTKPWSLDEAIAQYAQAGIGGITVWRQALAGHAPAPAGKRIRDAGLQIVSLCRGGFFPARDAAGRQAAIDENHRVIDEAAALGAPLVVLVCGAIPGVPLPEARRQISDGIAAVLPHATACGVKLAIEPLHPMYADDRSAINTMRQAADVCAELRSPALGIAVDVYHVWWDPDLETEIARAGRQGWLLAFHVCDWRTPTTDLLEDRGLPGEGCIPVRTIRGWVERAGFDGFREVEVFSKSRWAGPQEPFLRDIVRSYREHV